MANVKMSSVSKSFGKTRALEDFTLEIKQGELISLLGPSGCGKTTALRILAGLIKNDSGSIRFDDLDVTKLPATKRDIGMVFQAYSLFPNMTAKENVEFGLKTRKLGKSEISDRIKHIFEVIGLGNEMSRYPHELSGGQQQRIALARSIVVRPRILLLDEPLSALDAQVRTQLRDEIKRIQRQFGITTLFVTHDQEEAMTISDSVGVMHHGKLLQLDTPQNIYQNPSNPNVAKFVGTTNQIPVVIHGTTASLLGQHFKIAAQSDYTLMKSQTIALIRPENFKLLPPDQTGLKGKISNISFLGPISHVDVTLDSRVEVRIIASSQSISQYVVGSNMSLVIDAEELLITNV